jgi:hypothetical protein
MPAHPNNRDFALNVLLCVSMFALTVGGIVYVIIRGGVLEEHYGKGRLLANTNLYEAFTIAVVFLAAPLIGGCGAFRLARTADRSAKIIGWLLVVMFALFFVQAAVVDWTQYRYYHHVISK